MTPGKSAAPLPLEARSGLDPWSKAELPDPPRPKGLGWLGAVGPGVIVLGVSIGSGEFLLGPAVFVKYGFSLLWPTFVGIFLQTIFNTEVMRYTLATGEPVVAGFMRTRPSSTGWAFFYALLYFLQLGWPAFAGTAAGAAFFLFAKRLAGPDDVHTLYLIGASGFLTCMVVLSIGRRIERTLELLNWVLLAVTLGGFITLGIFLVPLRLWVAAGVGFFGFDMVQGRFNFLPLGTDFVLLSALVGYAGAGGVVNLTLSNWARDRGYGMGQRAGYIPAAVGGQHVNLAHSGFVFDPDAEGMRRWRGWWRIVAADQWGVFFTGGMAGMVLPSLLYLTFVTPGSDIQGLSISAVLAHGVELKAGAFAAGCVAFLGAWILFKTQLDVLEGTVRAVTDILWTGSRRVRSWRGGDIRAVYYAVLTVAVVWGIIALSLVQPLILLKLGANVASVVFVIASLHLLYINTTLLPPHVRPPTWRRVALVAIALFFGFFVTLSVGSFW